jgi:hypothetical protein
MGNGETPPRPDKDTQLREAAANFVVNGVPMEPEMHEELVTGDNALLLYELVKEKRIDLYDEQVKSRWSDMMVEIARHTISAPDNQPLGTGGIRPR